MSKALVIPHARKIARLLERAVAKAVGAARSPAAPMSLAARLAAADRATTVGALVARKSPPIHKAVIH